MDAGPVNISPKTALFAIGLAGAYAAWTVFANQKRTRIKVIVYHAPEDTYFADFREGVTHACFENDILLDYVSLASDISNLEEIMIDHILTDRVSNGFVVRVLNDRVADALSRARRPYVSVMSPFTQKQPDPLLAVQIGYSNLNLGPRDLVVVDDSQEAPPGTNIVSASPMDVLEKVSLARPKYDRLYIAGKRLSRSDVLDLLHLLSFKSIETVDFDGRKQGVRSITSVLYRT